MGIRLGALEGLFAAVSSPILQVSTRWEDGSLDSSSRDLQDLHTFAFLESNLKRSKKHAPLQTQNLSFQIAQNISQNILEEVGGFADFSPRSLQNVARSDYFFVIFSRDVAGIAINS